MKTNSLKVTLLSGLCAGVMGASAYAQTFSQNYSVGSLIPDNNASGLATTVQFSVPGLISISSLTVTLDISGGANSDYYAYLQHGTGFTVLLNRVGVDMPGNPTGYLDSGLNITLDDAAPNGDIHVYQQTVNPQGGTLTGTWAPDGRNVDPSTVTIGTPQTAMLSQFNGLNPNGSWTLFIADVSPGGVGTLQDFSLNVTGVPEPTSAWLLLVSGGSFMAGCWYRTRRSRAV